MTRPRFNRILLKLSGEALMGSGQFGIDPEAVAGLAGEIAAASPLALRGEDLDPSLIERERHIASEKAAESGKPADIVAKMVDGAMAKFRKENALMSQLFVMDNKTKVEDVIAAEAKRTGSAISLNAYVRFQLGEGIEKKESDFAAEVAAAAGTSKAEPVA